jgi:hypothetical protein
LHYGCTQLHIAKLILELIELGKVLIEPFFEIEI